MMPRVYDILSMTCYQYGRIARMFGMTCKMYCLLALTEKLFARISLMHYCNLFQQTNSLTMIAKHCNFVGSWHQALSQPLLIGCLIVTTRMNKSMPDSSQRSCFLVFLVLWLHVI